MAILKTATALLLASFFSAVTAAPTTARPNVVPNSYIVQLKPTVDLAKVDSHITWVQGLHARSIEARQLDLSGFNKKLVIDNFKAYTGTFDSAIVALIKANPDVLLVEEDMYGTYYDGFPPYESGWPQQSPALDVRDTLFKRGLVYQDNAPYGLRYISQKPTAKSNHYVFDSTAAQNTWGYVLDSGVNVAHQDFQGRASLGYNAVPGVAHDDKVGHGTHCAGIVGSHTWGVAKLSKIISVKVGDQSPSSNAVIDGISWSVNDIKSNGRVGKAVITMSLGFGPSQAINNAVKAAYDAGITITVAAGNSNADAANTSPANAPEAITVGAIDSNYARASYSNYGAGVDLFAPGTGIESTYIGSNTATRVLSGTSMAAPHVAGLALYFMSLRGVMPPGQLAFNMVRVSNKNAISGMPSGTPNNLAYNESGV